ncbi:hypothetical protein B484DRAFT_439921, partial [Ochromonadaceae sp. CCMP2298]
VLEDVLPPDAHEILNNRASNCYIAYTEITPSLQPQFVYRFKDKADLISVLRASCNIPFYFNGNSLAVGVRGTKGVDGFFTMSPNRPPDFLARNPDKKVLAVQLSGGRQDECWGTGIQTDS